MRESNDAASNPTNPNEFLEALPQGVTGEILNGQLYTQSRPSDPHGQVALNLAIGVGALNGN